MVNAIRRLGRLVDWKFLVALAALLLVSTTCYGYFQRGNQNERLISSLSATTSQVDRLNDQIDRNSKSARAERLALLRQNEVLLSTTKTQQVQLRAQKSLLTAIAKYLRAHGINVPSTVVPPPSTPAHPRTTKHPRTPGKPGGGGHPTPPPKPPGLPGLCKMLPVPLCQVVG